MTARKPLTIVAGQRRQLQATETLQLLACTTVNASLNAPHGTAPSSPVDGDAWTTTAGLYARINGVTVGPFVDISYIDTVVNGRSWKNAVRAATTVAGTLATSFENGDVIDGVTLATFDRILIKNQASAAENGIYTVNFSGPPTRASDADSGAELVDASCYVSEGTTLADTQWTCTANAPIILGVTNLPFVQSGSGSTYTADGATLDLTGTTFSVKSGGIGTTQLAANAVTLAKMQTNADQTVLGNVSGGLAVPVALTKTQLTTLINAFTATLSGAVPAPSASTGKYLKDDGTWGTPAGGGGTSGAKVSFGAPPYAYNATQVFSAGFAVALAAIIPNGGTIDRISFVSSAAAATAQYRAAVYSNSTFSVNAKQQESNVVTGVVQALNTVSLTSPYTNSSGADQLVWLVLATAVANFNIGTSFNSNAFFWNNGGTTLPSTAPAQTSTTIGWALWGTGSAGT